MTSSACDCWCHFGKPVADPSLGDETKQGPAVIGEIIDWFIHENPECGDWIPLEEFKINLNEFADMMVHVHGTDDAVASFGGVDTYRDAIRNGRMRIHRCRRCWERGNGHYLFGSELLQQDVPELKGKRMHWDPPPPPLPPKA